MSDEIYFYNANDFAYKTLLEENVAVIRTEFLALLNSDFQQWSSVYPNYLEKGSMWKTFEFQFFGIKNLKASQICPKTAEIISQIPELVTAQFSILFPHSDILPHKGYSRIVLRNHLPLIVPDELLCGIKIENQTHHWKEGELVVFDDSFLHEAWNHTDEIRVVLMFDVAKPQSGYSAKEICHYKLKNMDDPFLLNIAPIPQWLKWLEQGYFD